MGKETSQIERFHGSMDAFYIAFHSTFGVPYDEDNFAHNSKSNDHFELESSNPADTIPVATFLRNEQLADEIIKKQYFYVCTFEWAFPIGEIKDSTDLEELDKWSKGPKIKKTYSYIQR